MFLQQCMAQVECKIRVLYMCNVQRELHRYTVLLVVQIHSAHHWKAHHGGYGENETSMIVH